MKNFILIFMLIGVIFLAGCVGQQPTGKIAEVLNETINQSEPTTTTTQCIPNWQCNDWSECSSSGTQTRTCNDLNNCGTVSGKPSESQSCTYVTSINLSLIINSASDELEYIYDPTVTMTNNGKTTINNLVYDVELYRNGKLINSKTDVGYSSGSTYIRSISAGDSTKGTLNVMFYKGNTNDFILGTYVLKVLVRIGANAKPIATAEKTVEILTTKTTSQTITPSCTENWSCTNWGECSGSGTQTRKCTDYSFCGTTTSKPPESQSCTPSVKSATLTIDNVQIVLANLYPTRVTVTNTGNSVISPKFDIYVYDSQNNQVCSGSSIVDDFTTISVGQTSTGEFTVLGCMFQKDGAYTLKVNLLDSDYILLDSETKGFTVDYWSQFQY